MIKKNYRKSGYRKRNYRRYRKRPRKYNRRVRPYTKISRQPVAERYFTRLNYAENLELTLALPNTLYAYQYRSGIFDPDVTGTGHQPLWRDTLVTMYSNYRVYGIKYKIAIAGGSSIDMTAAYVKHNSDNVLDTNQYTLRERKEGRSVIVNGYSGKVGFIKGYMSVPKVFGIGKKEFISDEGFTSATTSDPTKLAYLQIYGVTQGGSTKLTMQLDLTYYVEFYNRVDIAGS